MNASILNRLSRVVRDSAIIASGHGNPEEHRPALFVRAGDLARNPAQFAPKVTQEQFLGLLADLKKPVTCGFLVERGTTELNISPRTLCRYLDAAVKEGSVRREVSESGVCSYELARKQPTMLKRADPANLGRANLAALREATIVRPRRERGRPEATAVKNEEIILHLTKAQHHEAALWAKACACSLPDIFQALTSLSLEQIFRGDCCLSEDIEMTRDRVMLYAREKTSVLQRTRANEKHADAKERMRAILDYEND